MIFSLFAPTIDEVKLILDDHDIPMNKQSDGTFLCSVNNISDGDHRYKFQISKKGWIFSTSIDIMDPYATKYDPEEQFGYITIKNGKKYNNEFNWQYDHIQLPENKELILYELYVADFSKNGQFSGVIDKLDYLSELGINAIELMPIMGSQGKEHDWGYLPRHFFCLKSTYGSINDLKLLVDKCHQRKIRVFLDCVFNHSDKECPLALIDRNYWYYKGKHHPDDPYWWGPEFNYEFEDKNLNIKPAVKFVTDVMKYWIKEFHLDGVRFDAAKQMDNYDILRHLDLIGRSIYPFKPFFSQAEYVPERKDLCKEYGGPVDTCWSSSFHESLRCFLAFKKDQIDKLENLANLKYIFSSKNFVNYLSCHDNERLLHDIGKKDSDAFIKMETAIILLFTSTGIPMIRQGEELGDDRELGNNQVEKSCFPMPWNLLEKDFNIHLLNTFKHLIKLRHTNKSLQEDQIKFFYEDNQNKILCYYRGINLVVITHFDKMPKTKYIIGNFPQNGIWIDYITNEQVLVDDVNNLTLDLLPFESRLYIKQT
ncbi:unnamed protein product [Rotaria sordida]|uniref:Glycosyl hydrolase family 13 catalytic domain-containing protein n=1 Tax=Rotaria sordida TaxID=392033 RepID=A0A819XCM6_9BILA|nr:unnamed protein product [Rotaria sordida]CAF4134044.1 unnamed protein product [Rotaria sordida]